MTKKKLRFGAIPTQNLPKKSYQREPRQNAPSERPFVQDVPSMNSFYKTLQEFCNRVKELKSLVNWISKFFVDKAVFKKMVAPFMLPHLEVVQMTVWH